MTIHDDDLFIHLVFAKYYIRSHRSPSNKNKFFNKCTRASHYSSIVTNCFRLKELDDKFAELVQQEEQFPPELLDVKTLYTNFYNEMTDLATNLVCASCGSYVIVTSFAPTVLRLLTPQIPNKRRTVGVNDVAIT